MEKNTKKNIKKAILAATLASAIAAPMVTKDKTESVNVIPYTEPINKKTNVDDKFSIDINTNQFNDTYLSETGIELSKNIEDYNLITNFIDDNGDITETKIGYYENPYFNKMDSTIVSCNGKIHDEDVIFSTAIIDKMDGNLLTYLNATEIYKNTFNNTEVNNNIVKTKLTIPEGQTEKSYMFAIISEDKNYFIELPNGETIEFMGKDYVLGDTITIVANKETYNVSAKSLPTFDIADYTDADAILGETIKVADPNGQTINIKNKISDDYNKTQIMNMPNNEEKLNYVFKMNTMSNQILLPNGKMLTFDKDDYKNGTQIIITMDKEGWNVEGRPEMIYYNGALNNEQIFSNEIQNSSSTYKNNLENKVTPKTK